MDVNDDHMSGQETSHLSGDDNGEGGGGGGVDGFSSVFCRYEQEQLASKCEREPQQQQQLWVSNNTRLLRWWSHVRLPPRHFRIHKR